jgi:hypothetical protein
VPSKINGLNILGISIGYRFMGLGIWVANFEYEADGDDV